MVGFRAFTRRNAVMLGVRGYVENLEDGQVHAVLEGEDHQVEKLLEMVRQGPAIVPGPGRKGQGYRRTGIFKL